MGKIGMQLSDFTFDIINNLRRVYIEGFMIGIRKDEKDLVFDMVKNIFFEDMINLSKI